MDTYKTTDIGQNDGYEDIERRIKEHLKVVLPEDVYNKWIDHFVFEKIDDKQIIVGYYGTESIKEFKREHKETVWIHICSVIGYVKKFKIYKRKNKESKLHTVRAQKNIRVAKLYIISFIFAVITFAIAIIGYNYIGNQKFKESFYSVSSLKADRKIRIIQISDLHNSLYGKENKQLISRIEKLKPDLIIYSGDCIDSDDVSSKDVVKLCSALAKVAPSYYIYGNNEVETFYDTSLMKGALDKKFGFNDDNRDPSKLLEIEDSFEKKLEDGGVKVLKNEMDSIVVGSTKVDIYGVLTSNPSAFWPYAGESFSDYIYKNPNNLKITAIHEPFIFEEFSSDSWGDILVCGHTHGGIVRVPMLGALYTHEGGLFPERKGDFVYGRYDVSGSPLIVSSGLENKNLLRINNQPELVIIDINRF